MLERRKTKGSSKFIRVSMLIVIAGLLVTVLVVFQKYQHVFAENVAIEDGHIYFYIPTGSTYEEMKLALEERNVLIDKKSFDWVANKKEYVHQVKSGRYKISDGMSNNELVNTLRSGHQAPVMLVFNNIRTLPQLAGKVASYLESDSVELVHHLLAPDLPAKYDMTKESFPGMFIPNTYEFFWNTSPVEFSNRMHREYEKFWDTRDRKAEKLNLTRNEVSTMASIVDEETLLDAENARVAGLYVNRLKKGIPFQADPTLRYALGDFSRQRILNVDKKVDSPYNTYKHRGIPPGPISIPSISAIDGVLNYERHNFLYMCAKADFSGNHAFARTLKQHNRNAEEYRRELDKRGIYR